MPPSYLKKYYNIFIGYVENNSIIYHNILIIFKTIVGTYVIV